MTAPRPAERERARISLLALDLVEAAASGATIETAADLARQMAAVVFEDLPREDQARVAAALATMAVWEIPRKTRPADVVGRMVAVKAWVARARLEWSWLAS